MERNEIFKFGEIQYIKGRLDELNKALPTITNMERSRKIDQRIEKYLQKLKKVDEISYYLYEIEVKSRLKSKERSKKEVKSLLEEVLSNSTIDEELEEKIMKKIDTY
jgi:uncharacterized protein YhaN